MKILIFDSSAKKARKLKRFENFADVSSSINFGKFNTTLEFKNSMTFTEISDRFQAR